MFTVSEISHELGQATWQDYLEICKPRVVLLMLLCTLVGMLLATPDIVPWNIVIFGNLGVALVASSAAALNHLLDSSIDAKMARTRNRPVVQGRINKVNGAIFIALTGISGLMVLMVLVNPLTAWLNLASWFGYGIFYTMYLKRATPQNIVVGGLFGAAPPLFGWTAVTNSIEPGALLLVLIIFAWTPPHFWALAIDRLDDYRDADIPMMPLTHGEHYTKVLILLYAIILTLTSVLPYLIGMSSLFYLLAAVGLGLLFVYWAIVLLIGKDPSAPIKTFRYSIIYLMLLFLALLVDHYITPNILII